MDIGEVAHPQEAPIVDLCPDHLDEMLKIVRELRRMRYEAMQSAQTANTIDAHVITPAQTERNNTALQ